jgi:shikimate dehydrogenase
MAARQVADLVGGAARDSWPQPGTWDLLVNATPAGWESNADLLPATCAGAYVYDLVSTPAVTPLLAHAAAAGCRAIPGVEMLVAQAEAQAAWWTGKWPNAGFMMRAAQHELGGTTCA